MMILFPNQKETLQYGRNVTNLIQFYRIYTISNNFTDITNNYKYIILCKEGKLNF